jgi:hypothetical protein
MHAAFETRPIAIKLLQQIRLKQRFIPPTVANTVVAALSQWGSGPNPGRQLWSIRESGVTHFLRSRMLAPGLPT